LIQRLARAGARSIVLDLRFPGPLAGDDKLKAALEEHAGRVVIGSDFQVAATDRGTNATLAPPFETVLAPADGRPAALDPRVGYVNVWADRDGVLRRAQYRTRNDQSGYVVNAANDAVIESLAARALRQFGAAEKIPDGFEPRRFRYTAPPGRAWEQIPVVDVLTPKLWERNYGGGAVFKDKLVLVGPTAAIFQDLHRTPFTEPSRMMLGPEVHLNILNAALRGAFLRETPFVRVPLLKQLRLPIVDLVIIALAGYAATLCVGLPQPLRRVLALLLANALYLIATQVVFERADLVLPAVSPLLALNVGSVAALLYDFVIERLERMKLRHTMGLYFSPRVLEAVLADPGSMQPRRAKATLLLTDLRNSTPLAEQLGPRGMFDLLNKVFEAQTNAIMSEEGNLEHFLGDQFLSYWGAPQPQHDDADRAARAALKLITAMESLRATLPDGVRELFGYGVALHRGSVLVGNKGSARRLDYGLVGDVVNEAARVEALTKFYGVTLLLTRPVIAKLAAPGPHRLVDRVIVKGKSEPVELFEAENPRAQAGFAALCDRYKAACDEYHFGRFAAAQGMFEQLAAGFNDGPARVLAARCAQLAAHPPADWNGVWKMESK
jgi:adenylate cyclase